MIIFRVLSVYDTPIRLDLDELALIGSDLVVRGTGPDEPCSRCPIYFHEESNDLDETNCGKYGSSCEVTLRNAFYGIFSSYSNTSILVRKMTLYESIYIRRMDLSKLEVYGEI